MGEKIEMEEETGVCEEPVSPRGRLFLQREIEHVIFCIVSFENPIDVEKLISSLSSSFVKNCPRLRSLVVKDPSGRERWKELPEIDVRNHVVFSPGEERGSDLEDSEDFVDKYVADMVSRGKMRRDIPLWDVHVLPRNHRSVVIRFHHALGDCLSLTALLLASFDKGENYAAVGDERESKDTERFSVVRTMKKVWCTIPSLPGYPLFASRLRQDKTLMAGRTKMDFLPRKMASVALCLKDMKEVKNKLDAVMIISISSSLAFLSSDYPLIVL